MPVYTMSKLKQVYGDRTVLQIDHLEIEAGEIFSVVGPSGAGKSTLLRLLGLLEKPSSGALNVSIGAHQFSAVNATIAQRRQVTMVFQRPFLMSRTVFDNVAYGLRIRSKYSEQAVWDVLERVSLTELAKASAHTLSGGEMQRVAVARALVIEPQVLLLDEPTANLDPYNARIIEDLIREQHERYQTTIALITHNIFQARRLATRVGLMWNSQLVEVAPKDDFFESPTDERTQAFLSGDLVY